MLKEQEDILLFKQAEVVTVKEIGWVVVEQRKLLKKLLKKPF